MRLFAAAAALALGSSAALAAPPPDYDAFFDGQRTMQAPGPLSDETARLVARGEIAHVETRLGVPTVFFADRHLAGPSLRSLGLTAEEAARRHLFTYAALYRQSPAVLAEAPLKHLHDTGRGAIIATFTKRVNGTPVFRDAIHVVMDRQLRLVALTGYTSPHQGTKGARWNLSRATAIATAFFDLTGQLALPADFVDQNRPRGGYAYFRHQPGQALSEDAPRAEGTIRVKDVLFGLPDALVPAYYLELDVGVPTRADSELYGYVISAVDGRLLFRRNLRDADSYTYKVWAETSGWHVPYDGPIGPPVDGSGVVQDGTPHPTGLIDGFQAPFVPPNAITVDALPFSQSATDSWLPPNATETTGNNVEAYADLVPSNGFTPSSADVRGVPTAPNLFDVTYDVTQSAAAGSAQRQAAIVSLFYVNNFLHDWYYDHGFDEQAGNAQASNYGRGGEEGDSIRAEAQDYSGTNNANMDTPADGARPRMQQYVFFSSDESLFEVTAPTSLAGNYVFGGAEFGPSQFDLAGDVVYPVDSDGSHTACGTFPAGSLTGKIALVDRGGCSFAPKAERAEQAGAIGMIVVNNQNNGAITMSQSNPPATVTIPTVSLAQDDGALLKQAIANAQTVSVHVVTFARDGSIDNQVVAHEWAHYLSNRLVGDASGLSNHQGRAMGEGWSDFNALLMTVRAADANAPANANYSGVYALATYVNGGLPSGSNQGFYFGIRRVPYSTDLGKDGLTFRMIEDGVPLSPSSGNPSFPVAYGASGGSNAEVHATGEVWCTMLWEGYAGLLNATGRYTFDQAQDTMKDYLVASLKATPNAPTMLEARDALLAVVAASNAQDFASFTAAFAKRGAGIGAVAPDRMSVDHDGTVESFLSGGDAQLAGATLDDEAFWCDHDGTLDDGETGFLSITLKNVGWTPLSALTATVSSSTPGVTVGNGGQLSFGALAPYASGSASVPVTLNGVGGAQVIALELTWDDPAFAIPGPRTQTIEFLGNVDQATAVATIDNAEAPTSAWTFGFDPSLSDVDQGARVELGVQDHVYWLPNPAAPADLYLVSPPLDVAASGSFSFTFRHAFEFESNQTKDFDGGVLELSTDNGATWTKIPQSALSGQQYNVTLDALGTNPLAGQLAFGDVSPGFPNLVSTTVDLGTAFAGQTVQIRFRAGGDDNTAGRGWYIDDLDFTGITNTPFNALVANAGVCVNRPPIANAGTDQQVDERTAVVLDASATVDPDGDAVTLTWQQVDGPAVTFTGDGAFTAPEVTADTELTFQLVASDGQLQSTATTHVLVRQVNRKPTAVVPPAFIVEERTLVRLDGSQSTDVDGDPVIQWQWTQVSGPKVTLSSDQVAAPTFTSPEVLEDTPLVFELVVSDGALFSDPVPLEVTLKQVNRAPEVTVTPHDAVDERAEVTLEGAATDPDEEDAPALVYVWSQSAGPKAELTPDGATLGFVAPEVTQDTEVTFTLRVYDGAETRVDRLYGEAELTLTVRQVNQPPVARAGSDRTAAPGSHVSVGGPSSDPDGDPLTYSWTQIDGPEVQFTGAGTPYISFDVPQTAAPGTAYKFELTVHDGALQSEPDHVTVTVEQTPGTASGCGCGAGPSGAVGSAVLLLVGALARIGRRRSF